MKKYLIELVDRDIFTNKEYIENLKAEQEKTEPGPAYAVLSSTILQSERHIKKIERYKERLQQNNELNHE